MAERRRDLEQVEEHLKEALRMKKSVYGAADNAQGKEILQTDRQLHGGDSWSYLAKRQLYRDLSLNASFEVFRFVPSHIFACKKSEPRARLSHQVGSSAKKPVAHVASTLLFLFFCVEGFPLNLNQTQEAL